MKTVKAGILIFCIVILAFSSKSYAQDDLNDLLKGSKADATYLLEGYVGPAMRAFGSGLNQGWYNTAKPHKTLGFDFTITTSLMYIPSDENLYTVDNTKLSQVKLLSYDGQPVNPTGSGKVPTIFGADKTPQYQVGSNTPFSGPPGLDLKNTIKVTSALPVPMYVLGIGLPKSIDLKVRFSPSIKSGDFEFNLFGIGVMHDVKQYIPGIKALPFDLSAFVGFTKMKAEQGLDVSGGANQRAIMEFNSTTIQAIISKKISVLTGYASIGYNLVKSNIDMKGTYDLDDNGTAEATDPLALRFSSSGVRATGGLRLKLAVITLHGDYTLAKYNSLSVGFGINVR